jgi:phosphate-selective porin
VKNVFKVLAIMATLGMSAVAMAKDPTTKPAGLRGKVQSIDGMVITIKNKTGEVTIETDANTTFTLDGQPATLADVKAGERVVSASPTTGVASEVKLTSGGGKKKKDKEPTTAPTAN